MLEQRHLSRPTPSSTATSALLLLDLELGCRLLDFRCFSGRLLGFRCCSFSGRLLSFWCFSGKPLGFHQCCSFSGRLLGFWCFSGRLLGFWWFSGQLLGFWCFSGQLLGFRCFSRRLLPNWTLTKLGPTGPNRPAMVRPHLLAPGVVSPRHRSSNEATKLGNLLGPIITTSYYIFILHLPIAPSYYTSSYILHLSITSSYCIFLLHLPITSSYYIFLLHLPITSSYYIFASVSAVVTKPS